MLRNEFYRKGGPRGSGGHAEIDKEAEKCIYGILFSDYADNGFGYTGEELGAKKTPADDKQHCWLVDPNDGTSAFLKNHRGSAVSIALLRAGEPVLGVIYAFCAPDDQGDLFAWAEGFGPLRRNGQPVIRQWADELSRESTILVSQDADKNSMANAEVAAPARFRTVPGIAYRLALVAAGEGDAAVSLNGPVGWDYAAGHALIRAAGGELINAGGKPVTYSVTGGSSCGGRCFGGGEKYLQKLAGKPWERVFAKPSALNDVYPLIRPEKGKVYRETAPVQLARAQGCLLGQFAGDALGSLVEFKGPESITKLYPDGPRELLEGGTWVTLAGQPTDDSEMALMLARSIVESGTYSRATAARAYAHWYNTKPFDIGNTTAKALALAARALRDGGDPEAEALQSATPHSQANGGLMRISPLGVVAAAADTDAPLKWAGEDAELTHPNPVCVHANRLFAFAIREAIRGSAANVVFDRCGQYAAEQELSPEIIRTLQAASEGPPDDFLHQQGWVLIALQNAFYQLLHAPSFEAGVIDTVRRGGDTDTNAAICGALLGAVYGREAVPAQWRDRILTCRPIDGLSRIHRPRPCEFWPVDALELAERLLWIGSSLNTLKSHQSRID
ncbi:MAG: ADP-ribosylglycohydrolase family protein [Deltaproteobacteria bacterium]|nr:ADP-ribosylglycohydrolase family protein [Deltaproteobacteria bacterium]